eukprot:7654827-Alexandrium_andersonii.AAC.1
MRGPLRPNAPGGCGGVRLVAKSTRWHQAPHANRWCCGALVAAGASAARPRQRLSPWRRHLRQAQMSCARGACPVDARVPQN